MNQSYEKILKKLIESLDGNLQLRTTRGGASHPYQKTGYKRVYGKSDYDDYVEDAEYMHQPDDFKEVKVSRAFHGDMDVQ